MSLSLTSHLDIQKHQSNNSPTKVSHQFSKTPRFLGANPECPNAFYSYDSQLSNRKTSFGYGKKSDFTNDLAKSPPASKYEIKSFVDMNKIKSRGKSIGLARQKLPDNSYLIPQIHKNPGPGAYDNEKSKFNNMSWTARPKPVDMIDKNLTYKQTPGPGQYQTVDFQNKKGRIHAAKYEDAYLSIINRCPRFAPIKLSPGPGDYTEGSNLNGGGKYSLSQHKGEGARVFSKTTRFGGFGGDYWRTSKNPGPGDYKQTSQFGHYGDSRQFKTMELK